ncbi:MAG: hypothetical protein AMDU4_FER2C00078G0019 [Ferroplasma sp. Type II]|nr:MAG: hypothetical protein AMDU4_FER2C00263G0002 [Ferroplasma sp. Type II]EQB73331.1 MAG: hypothetical protein AMDU4_FER2C00078G0019 [Ferroplasma sp. Type II]
MGHDVFPSWWNIIYHQSRRKPVNYCVDEFLERRLNDIYYEVRPQKFKDFLKN